VSRCDQCGSCVSLARVLVTGPGWRVPETRLWCAKCRGEPAPALTAPAIETLPPATARDTPPCRGCGEHPRIRGGLCRRCDRLLVVWAAKYPGRVPGADTLTGRALVAITPSVLARRKRGQAMLWLQTQLRREVGCD